MTQERLASVFHTDVTEQVLYIQTDLGLKMLSKVLTVARARLRPGYTTVPVPVAQLRKIIALRQQSKSTSRNAVKVSTKPTPPGSLGLSQLTRTGSRGIPVRPVDHERRNYHNVGFAPLRDWWPAA